MSNKKNILVTGANGQLGMEFRALAEQFAQFHFLFVSREQLAIEDLAAIKNYFTNQSIDYCINCAAYTAVDKAESEKEASISINATAVGNLAAVCKEYQTRFFHFSTDYVFNGQASQPYKETDSTDPVNFYGQTKLQGEQAAFANNENSIIIRTSWVYSRFGKNFVKTMLRLMSERESIGVVADQVGCPTYAADLAAAVMQIIDSGKFIPGIYHYCNEGIISWHDFAMAIKELSESKCAVNAIETAAYPTPAARPHYSALDTQKIKESYGLDILPWKQRLETCIKGL
ncbi:MAG TPA: dTDP-4-dehydrorhamnose reductase [Ferruginibacter sp.]|nr:dTDP-4-dehydrorhamnose reductase [Ferruginibacter sp.]